MRLLFVSSTTVGGSGRSQRELARKLRDFGHEVEFLVDDGRPARVPRWIYSHLSDLSVRLAGTRASRPVVWLERRPGRRTGTASLDGISHRTSPVPQNALESILDSFVPDAVVCNSLERFAWRRVQVTCATRSFPTVLYVRETDSLEHLAFGQVPDVLIANAESLCAALVDQGHTCHFVPSVIDTSVTRATSTRRVALAINPIPSRGSEMLWRIAAEVPEIPVAVQESWELTPAQLAEVERQAARLSNVEVRRAAPPGPELYRDARVLLVPYKVDNRPRVIAEVQANGIPVLVGDMPALVEAIGDGGISVPLDSVDRWAAALRTMWTDEVRYEELSKAAWAHSRRPDIDPDLVARRFEKIVLSLVST